MGRATGGADGVIGTVAQCLRRIGFRQWASLPFRNRACEMGGKGGGPPIARKLLLPVAYPGPQP